MIIYVSERRNLLISKVIGCIVSEKGFGLLGMNHLLYSAAVEKQQFYISSIIFCMYT